MRASLSFRLGGIPVSVDAMFFVMVIVLGLGRRSGITLAGWLVAIFVSVLVHELGHAVAFRVFGQSSRIQLWAWGGLTYGSAPLPPWKDVVVNLAGSATAIALLGLPAYVVTRTMTFTSFSTYLFWHDLVRVSLAWSLLNLLPLLPFDGGNVARTVLRGAMGERGEVTALWLSISVAVGGGAWALFERQPFLAMYGVFFAGYSAQQLVARRDAPLGDELTTAVRRLEDDPDAAAIIARHVLGTARGRATLTRASEVAAWAALARERDDEAQEIVRQIGPNGTPSPVLDGCAALVIGDRDRGLRRLVAGMTRRPKSFPGTIAMRCIARSAAADELTTRLLDRPGDDGPKAAAMLALGMHLIGRLDEAVASRSACTQTAARAAPRSRTTPHALPPAQVRPIVRCDGWTPRWRTGSRMQSSSRRTTIWRRSAGSRRSRPSGHRCCRFPAKAERHSSATFIPSMQEMIVMRVIRG